MIKNTFVGLHVQKMYLKMLTDDDYGDGNQHEIFLGYKQGSLHGKPLHR